MSQPLNSDIVRKLLNDSAFSAYIKWLTEEVDELNSVEGLEGMANEAAGEEVRVRAKALEKLHLILSPFIEYRTKREPSLEEFKKAKDSFGL